jgi:hypothetical protein
MEAVQGPLGCAPSALEWRLGSGNASSLECWPTDDVPEFLLIAGRVPTPPAGQPAMARISGVVIDEHDRPIPGATVALPCPPAPVRYVTSDEAGRFLLDNLPPAICLDGSKEGYVSASLPVDPGVYVAGAYSLVIRQGESRDGHRLQLTLGARITG